MKNLKLFRELIVDNFAGGGGASTGIKLAIGRDVDVAVNHDEEAVLMHCANHPNTKHYCEDVWNVDPVAACGGQPVGLAWFSPDCKHFSKAKGAKPVSQRVRGLAWLAVKWAKAVKPRIIMLENVEEFVTWGPLGDDQRPCPKRKGQTFARWVSELKRLGYVVAWRELRACDFGAPTLRKRLFLVARCDGKPIQWPKPTHGKGLIPYRTAADCIDWSIPCPSIFDRERPLAENTMRRIARGVMKYVVNSPKPFIVPVTHSTQSNVHPIDEPMRTVTTAKGGEFALVTPIVVGLAHGDHARGAGGRAHSPAEPLRTIHAGGGNHAIVVPTLVQTGYGERDGQAPRSLDIGKPLGTVVGSGKHALVAAFLAKHNGIGKKQVIGQDVRGPVHTITATDQKAVVATSLVKLRGTSTAQGVDAPLHTISAQGTHFAEVRAFLLKYYGTDQDPQLLEPMHTLTTKDRFALVTVEGVDYEIVDIGMRMLTPRELFRAQGFPDDYIIGDDPSQGLILTKTAQVRMCGNSVCPPLSRALVQANYGDAIAKEIAA